MLRFRNQPATRLLARTLVRKQYRSLYRYNYGFTYEIDLVTLKRSPHHKQLSMKSLSKLKPLKLSTINSEIIDNSINSIKYNKANNKNAFTNKYHQQLCRFLKFLNSSRNITQFDQLSSHELIQQLFVFKTKYHNKKINVNDIAEYDGFIDVFVEKLTDPAFPKQLAKQLPNYNDNLIIVNLYKHGIGNFLRELKSLNREFDFLTMSAGLLSEKIGNILRQFDQYFQLNYDNDSGNSIVDSNFFKILIQINRYKSLKDIFDSHPDLQIDHLKDILQDENALAINEKIRQASNESDIIDENIEAIKPLIELLQEKVDFEFDHPFIDYAPLLYDISKSEVEPDVKEAAIKVLETLLPLFYDGLLSTDDTSYLFEKLSSPIAKGKGEYVQIPDNLELENEVSSLQKLRSALNKDFKSSSAEEVLLCLQNEIDSTDDLPLRKLKHKLLKLFSINNGNTEVLDILLFNVDVFKQVENKINTKPQPKSNNENVQTVSDGLEEYIYQLQLLQEQILGQDFKLFTGEEVTKLLQDAIDKNELVDEDVSKFVNLNNKLKAKFDANGGNTEFLDLLLSKNEATTNGEEILEPPQPTKLKEVLQSPKPPTLKKVIQPPQPTKLKDSVKNGLNTAPAVGSTEIPSELQLNQFIRELKVIRDTFLQAPFAESTAEDVSSTLAHQINHIYSSDSSPSINNDNVLNFIRLHKRLNRLFKLNGGNTAVLDHLLAGENDIDEADTDLLLKYVQIPEYLPVHSFTPELSLLREELGKRFAYSSANEIDGLLALKVDDVLNKSRTNSRITAENVHQFIKLRQILARLFAINGGNTEVLDAVIFSEHAFEEFERSKLDSRPNQQLADDLRFKEYILELIQLRSSIGSSFADTPAEVILDRIQGLVSETNCQDRKRIWNKLYENIRLLFSNNNNNTSILDKALLNGEGFIRYELEEALEGSSQPSVLKQVGVLLNNHFECVEDFLKKLKLSEERGILQISENKFNELIDLYEIQLDKSSNSYPLSLYVMESFRILNSKVEYFPNFLEHLYEIKKNKEDHQMTTSDVEIIYKSMINLMEYDEQGVPEEIEVVTLRDEEELELNLKPKQNNQTGKDYNDSERLLAILTKESESANLDEIRDRLSKEDQDEFIIKDAISIAMNKDYGKPEDFDEVNDISSTNVRRGFNHKSIDESNFAEINKESIEKFLKKAKKEKDTAKEGKSREFEAYEWSKSMLNQRSLGAHNFFDRQEESSRGNLLFPTSAVSDPGSLQYLLLSVEGETTPTKYKLIERLPKEDIFQILNKFDKKDLVLFAKSFKKLQHDNWKVIASKNDAPSEKYLVLSRSKGDHGQQRWIFARIKTIFATTGAICIILVCADMFLEEKEHKKDSTIEESSDESTDTTAESDIVNDEKSIKGWKRLFWKID